MEIRQFKKRQNFPCLFQSKSANISRRQNYPIYGISKQWQYRIEKQALSAYINSSPVNINKRCVLSRYDYIWENFNWKTYDYNDDDDDDDDDDDGNDDSDDDDNDDEDMNQKIVMVTNWWIWMMANSIEIYLYYRITHTCVLYWALGQ